jgi:hypothetical protein
MQVFSTACLCDLLYRLIPAKLAAMPRWSSDQSNPSASAR